ncbi:MAG: ABC transporter permease, partial [Thermoplasmata archaeon]|nr:ABC transporter permease [Thermoplasmata archaeon]
MKMWIYIIRRALLLIPVIIGVMTVTFLIVSQLPVDDKLLSYIGPSKNGYSPTLPCDRVGINSNGTCPNPAYVRGIRQLGLDKPIPVQWAVYVMNSLTLNWGSTEAKSQASESFGLGSQPITTVLGMWLPYTLELAALSLMFILLLAVPLGNYSAVYRNRPLDQGARIMSFSGFALPGFLLAFALLVGASVASGNG